MKPRRHLGRLGPLSRDFHDPERGINAMVNDRRGWLPPPLSRRSSDGTEFRPCCDLRDRAAIQRRRRPLRLQFPPSVRRGHLSKPAPVLFVVVE